MEKGKFNSLPFMFTRQLKRSYVDIHLTTYSLLALNNELDSIALKEQLLEDSLRILKKQVKLLSKVRIYDRLETSDQSKENTLWISLLFFLIGGGVVFLVQRKVIN